MLEIKPAATGQIGAIVCGLNVDDLTSDEAKSVLDTVYRDKLVVIKDQQLDTHQYLKLAKKLGTPQVYFQSNYHHKDHPEIFVSSNVLDNGRKDGVSGTGQYWHTDCSFQQEPLSLTMVYPQIIPPSVRYTNYIDLEMVYNKMPQDLKQYIADKVVIHEGKLRYKIQPSDIDRSLADIIKEVQQMAPAVKHPAIITHPVTGKQSLYMSEGFSTGIDGCTHEESERMLQKLLAFIDQPEHVHIHHWSEGDILLWDNRPLIHKASPIPKGEQSKSYRIGIYDEHEFYRQ